MFSDNSDRNPLPGAAPAAPAGNRVRATIRATFEAHGGRTQIARVYETGGLRLRHPHTAKGCEAVIVNTGGGFTGGDRAEMRIHAAAGSDVTVTTQAAEKLYRAVAEPTSVDVSLQLDAGAKLEWLPQETILFDQARLQRRLDVAMAADASLMIVEALVFGRLAKGEAAIHGAIHDSWRIRRGGKLIFAEELKLEGALGAALDRPAVGRGARASAILLHVAPESVDGLAAVRAALDGFDGLDQGASAWNGMLALRLVSPSPERLRMAILAALAALRGREPPRVWQ